MMRSRPWLLALLGAMFVACGGRSMHSGVDSGDDDSGGSVSGGTTSSGGAASAGASSRGGAARGGEHHCQGGEAVDPAIHWRS